MGMGRSLLSRFHACDKLCCGEEAKGLKAG